MANKKITELTALTTPASTDVLAIVDVAGAETKKITVANLTGGGGGGLLTQVETTVSNADVLTMKYNDTPITLVAAEAGKIIVPTNINIVATWGTPNESSSDDLRIGWNASTSATTQYFSSLRDYMNGVSSGIRSVVLSPNNTTFSSALRETSENKPLQAWCNDNFLGGWSMKIYTTYYTITV